MNAETAVPLLVDLQGAATLTGISVGTLRRIIERRELAVVRLGTGKIWIERDELDAFIARRREPAVKTR